MRNNRTTFRRTNPFPLRIWATVTFILLLLSVPGRAGAGEAPHDTVLTVFPAAGKVVLDGIFNESDWKNAVPVTTFTQRELVEGEPSTERTEVRALYDHDNLYLGVICLDSDPEAIISKELKRDSEMTSDDTFSILIDTFRDRRSGYLFITNPNGTRYDALVKTKDMGASGSTDESWNAVWNVAARTDDRGWTAEFVIPFKTLRFPTASEQRWSINFRRAISRKNEEALWFSWRQNQGLLQLSNTGTLAGIKGIERKRQADIKPYIMTGLEKQVNEKLDSDVNYGLDVKYPLTSDLTLDVTTFTDFAQVESDRDEINLSRFSIRYPEKREFFIEGSEIFDFASRVSSPFYSRRIGISPDREQVPILGGAKLIGKAGSYNIGAISMQTDEKNDIPSANYSIVRVKKDVLEKSYIGLIATNVTDSRHDSQAYGADFAYNTSDFLGDQNLSFGGYIAENNSPGIHHGRRAGRLYLSLPNDLYRITFLYHALGKSYYPEIGYVDRNGIRKYETNFSYTPRTSIPHVKKLTFSPGQFRYITDSGTKLMTRTLRATPLGIEFNSGDTISLLAYHTYENLEESFTIFRNVQIPRGEYSWRHYSLSGKTSPKRPVALTIAAETGEFWSGKKTSIETGGTFKVSKFYSLGLEAQTNSITMGSQTFSTKEYSTRIVVDLTPNLNSRTFIQWNNETDVLNINFLLHYIPKVGSDIYFVYNHLFNEEEHYSTLQNTGILKVSYLFRF